MVTNQNVGQLLETAMVKINEAKDPKVDNKRTVLLVMEAKSFLEEALTFLR